VCVFCLHSIRGALKCPKIFPQATRASGKFLRTIINSCSGSGEIDFPVVVFFYLGSSLIGFTWTNWSAAAHTSLSLCEKYKINAGTSVCENIYDTHPLTRSHTHTCKHTHTCDVFFRVFPSSFTYHCAWFFHGRWVLLKT